MPDWFAALFMLLHPFGKYVVVEFTVSRYNGCVGRLGYLWYV